MAWKLISVQRPQRPTPATYTKRSQPTAQAEPQETPAAYFLNEILALHGLGPDDLRQIHQAKLSYPGVRLLQDG